MDAPIGNNYKRDAGLAGLGASAVLLFIICTDPSKLSAMFLLVFPLLVAITSFIVTRLVLTIFLSVSQTALRVISSVVGVGVLLVVLLGSLGQLGFQDMLLAFLLVAGLVFYLKRVHA